MDLSIVKELTKANTAHIKAALEAIDFIGSVEYVGRVELCGSSSHDCDFLAAIKPPIDEANMNDKEIFQRNKERCQEIAETLGEFPGTSWGYSGIANRIEHLDKNSKLGGENLFTHISLTTVGGFPIEVWFCFTPTALESVNHDYFADKVQWRIDGGCP